MLIAEIAQCLDDNGLLVFDPTGVTGDTYLERLPETNPAHLGKEDVVIAILSSSGLAPQFKQPIDSEGFQIVTRGGADPRAAYAKAYDIYNFLHGIKSSVLKAGGQHVFMIHCLAWPGGRYRDDNNRTCYSTNYLADVHNTETKERRF